MALRNQGPSSAGAQGGKPSDTNQGSSKPSPQGLIGSAGVKPSGIVERSVTIPSMDVIRESIRSTKSE